MPANLTADLVYANRYSGTFSGTSLLEQTTPLYRVRGQYPVSTTGVGSISAGLEYANHLYPEVITGSSSLTGDLVLTTLRGTISGESSLTGDLVFSNHLIALPFSGYSYLAERIVFAPPYFPERQLFREMQIPGDLSGDGGVFSDHLVRIVDVSGGGYWMDLDGFTILVADAIRVRTTEAEQVFGTSSLSADLVLSDADDLLSDSIDGVASLSGGLTYMVNLTADGINGVSSLQGAVALTGSLRGRFIGSTTISAASLQYITQTAPTPPSPPTQGDSATSASPVFLGRGILAPFRRDGKGDFAAADAAENVRACVHQVLGTECSIESGNVSGELPWRPQFGSVLYRLRQRLLDETTRRLAEVFVADALKRWEPRVRLTRVDLSTRKIDPANVGGPDALFIKVWYEIIKTNTAANAVVIPGVQEVRL